VALDLFLYEWFKAENQNRPPSAFDRQFSITPPLHGFSDEAGSSSGKAYYVPGESLYK
jgi:hypothetical protein